MVIKVYSTLSTFFFWLHHPACGILAPQPGIEPAPSAVKAGSPNHWTSREFPVYIYFFFFFNEFIYLFIYFWPCWVFVAAHGLSLVEANGGYSSLQWVGFSLRWLLVQHGL